MSGEGSDTSYRPKKREQQPAVETRRRTRCPRSSRVDYTEVEILSGSDSEGTIDSNKVDRQDIKSERKESVPLLEVEGEQNQWTPGTLTSRTTQLTQQLSRVAKENREFTMARETEQGGLVKLMELMIQMRADDAKAAQSREERRECRMGRPGCVLTLRRLMPLPHPSPFICPGSRKSLKE